MPLVAKVSALFVWLFGPTLDTLLRRARMHGSVVLQDEQGAGWYCTITPPSFSEHEGQRRRINAWSGRMPTPRASVIEALDEAANIPVSLLAKTAGSAKLGGAEFDE